MQFSTTPAVSWDIVYCWACRNTPSLEVHWKVGPPPKEQDEEEKKPRDVYVVQTRAQRKKDAIEENCLEDLTRTSNATPRPLSDDSSPLPLYLLTLHTPTPHPHAYTGCGGLQCGFKEVQEKTEIQGKGHRQPIAHGATAVEHRSDRARVDSTITNGGATGDIRVNPSSFTYQ